MLCCIPDLDIISVSSMMYTIVIELTNGCLYYTGTFFMKDKQLINNTTIMLSLF